MAKLRTMFMFSGQGSQYYRMGEPLYANNAVFRRWMEHFDACGRKAGGASIIDLIYDPQRSRADRFAISRLSGASIFAVEYSLTKALEAADVRADLVLGSSLGSYAAAAVAGAIAPERALTTIIEQSDLFERHCPSGCMLAIMADPALFDTPELSRRSALAAVNFSSHFVIAGLSTELDWIERFLEERSISCQRLPVQVAFHSRWIDGAREPFRQHVAEIETRPPLIPLVCCARAQKLDSIPTDFFWKVVRDPIEFGKTIAALEREGPYRYVDVGPSGTLAGFLRYLLPEGCRSQVQRVLSPYGGELKSFEAAIAA